MFGDILASCYCNKPYIPGLCEAFCWHVRLTDLNKPVEFGFKTHERSWFFYKFWHQGKKKTKKRKLSCATPAFENANILWKSPFWAHLIFPAFPGGLLHQMRSEMSGSLQLALIQYFGVNPSLCSNGVWTALCPHNENQRKGRLWSNARRSDWERLLKKAAADRQGNGGSRQRSRRFVLLHLISQKEKERTC